MFTELLASGFVDTFRHFNPELTGAYTWWSYNEDYQREKHWLED